MAPDGETDVTDSTAFKVELKDAGFNVLEVLGTKDIYEGMPVNSAYFDVYPGHTYYINELENLLYRSVNCNNLSTGELSSGSVVNITCINDQMFAAMTIYKLMLNPDGFEVYDSTVFTVDVLINGQSVEQALISAVEGSTGTVVNNLVPGTYTIEEQLDPNYVQLGCVESEVELESGSTETVVICTNQQMVGSITVNKDVINPDGNDVVDATPFSVNLVGPNGYNEVDTISELSEAVFEDLNPGTYYLTETPNDDYERINCENLEIVVGSNDHSNSITCINKQMLASFDIEKNVLGPNGVSDVLDNEEFTVTVYDGSTNEPVDGYVGIPISEENPHLNVVVNPGSYYVVEDDNPNYTEMGCGNGVTLSSNDNTDNLVTCTNWQNDVTVLVYKDVINYDDQDINDSTEFTVNLNGVNGSIDSDTGVISDSVSQTPASLSVVPGGYELTEVSEYGYENMGCRVGREGELETVLSLNNLTSGDTIFVYCVNKVQVGNIRVYKQLVDVNGDEVFGDTTEFQFELNGNDTQIVIPGGYVEYENLLPGSYDVTELDSSDYQIYGYEGDEDAEAEGLQITVVPEETSQATIINQQLPATLIVEKYLFREVDEVVEDVLSEVEFETEVRDADNQVVPAEGDSPYISHNGESSKEAVYSLNPGSYNLTELEKVGFIFHGCSIKENDLVRALDEVQNYNVEVGSNEEVRYVCVNEVVNPDLEITKSNDKLGEDLLAGDSVVYTILVTAPESEDTEDVSLLNHTETKYVLNDVVVTDLTPEGIEYASGTWSAKKNGLDFVIPEPTYNSPGTWNLGTMEEGDVVILTYLANISTAQGAGTYDDLAWVKGTSVVNETVIGDGDDGYFAGTNVRVINEVEEGKAEVLGVSLPSTGAEAVLTILAIIASVLGFILIALSGDRKKLVKTGVALFVVLAGLFTLMAPSDVQAADSLNVKVQQPKTPSNRESFKLGYVSLDVEGRDVTITCQVMRPGEVVFTDFEVKSAIAGGNSGDCLVTNTILSTDGTYGFKVVASVVGGTAPHEVMSTTTYTLDTTGPEMVKNYEKIKGVCTYTLKFTTANDGETSKVQIFRSSQKSFVANSTTLVKELAVTPNQNVEYTDTVPNCDTEYYYAVRAVDSADNNSDFASDTVVTVIPGVITDDGDVQGVDTGNQEGEDGGTDGDSDDGDVKGEEEEEGGKDDGGEDKDKETESDLQKTLNKAWDWLKYVLLALAVLGLGGLGYVYYVNRKSQSKVK